MPLRYEHDLPERSIADAARAVPEGSDGEANVAVQGEIASLRVARARKSRIEAGLADGTGTIRLTWFNMPWLRGRLRAGQQIRAWGRATRYGSVLQIVNPRWSPIDDTEPAPAREERYRPVYPGSETLGSEVIDETVGAALEPALATLDDHLPADHRAEVAMPELAAALRAVHRPEHPGAERPGRRRLAYDELLLLQLGVMLKRAWRRRRLRAVPLPCTPAVDAHIRDRFPFTLTDGQRRVIDEIAADLARTVPMNRLLQGDVGAGKTAVALHAMLVAVACGHQAAIMAPTELLAEQHHRSITAMLEGGQVSVELLVGSLRAAERRSVTERLGSGEIDLIVGTHALLGEAQAFRSLAVAVIDEQHRFGVHQRAVLRSTSGDDAATPHVLVMTATPIPRTLSLTVFGDLDVSTIRGLPPGRRPVISKHVESGRREVVYDYVARRLDAGDQAFVVVPVIDESSADLLDVQSHLAWLRDGPMRGRELEALHGRLPRDEREAIIGRFREGGIQALVTTTVVEVGVDIPNANVMVIEHAERFGLAQLHQLRGRVGRSGAQGLCVLVADPSTPDARARVDAFTATTDGFTIAEKDLEIRGPGEVFGARQSGLAPFRVAALPDDRELLALARRQAEAWVDANPTLAGPRDAAIKRLLLDTHGAALGLVDVA